MKPTSNSTRLLGLTAGMLFLSACSFSMPSGVSQTGGDGGLVVDLADVDPLTIGAQSVVTLRGPDKGAGERGGVTTIFTGAGGPMCVIMDPSNVYDGDYTDDGDVDLFVGRAADYSGQPGLTIGDFFGEYVDSLGISHPLDQNLCVQIDLFGQSGAHAGVGTVEYCTVQTDAGTPYLVLGETFSVSPASKTVTVAIRVDNGGCPNVNESTLSGDNN